MSSSGSRTRRGVALGVGGALAVGAAVVAVNVVGTPSAQAASLQTFGSCEELAGWYRDSALEQVTAWGLGGGPMLMAPLEDSAGASRVASPAAGADAGATGGAVGSSGAGTNVQEEGVDEPTRVALAGGLAYTLVEERLVVVDVAAGAVVGEVDLGTGAPDGGSTDNGTADGTADGSAYPTELLLVGDRVVVLGYATLPAPAAAAGDAAGSRLADPGLLQPWGVATTTMTTVDVGDPSAPVVLARAEVEGGYVSARASDGVVRVVTTSQPVLPFVDPWRVQQESNPAAGTADAADAAVYAPGEPDPAAEQEALERNRQVVRDATAVDWLPDLVERGTDGTVTSTRPVDCGTVAHPGEGAGTGTLTVLSLDPAAEVPLLGTTSVSADGSVVYASTDRLYVATTRGGWLWGGAGGQQELSTELHGFDITGAATDYLGSGRVDGWLLGPWAMDASEGYLRVGTTSRPAPTGGGGDGTGTDLSLPAPAGGDSSSSVVVLRETGDGLVQSGRVDGLGPGEQIRSLRWFDDLAVVVTFEQTDPLYTIDLADPAAPRVLGELKVTGYSGYLHPVGDGMLLGVGQAGDEAGTLLGAKVETYDLRDLAAPAAVTDLMWPGASTAAEWDSRLFAYLPERRVAVLPLEQADPTTGMYTSGLVAVSVGADGSLAEVGRWEDGLSGWTGALATDGDVVVAVRETYSTVADPDGMQTPRRTLAVLEAGDLGVRVEVDLG